MTIFTSVLQFALLLAALPFGLAVIQVRHDDSFQPDYILRISSDNMTLACRTRPSTVVNGTSWTGFAILYNHETLMCLGTVPGPALYLKENQTTWVRVYNDLLEANTTMVRKNSHLWSQEIAQSLQHWHGLSSIAPYSDGSPQASQWPIKVGNFRLYTKW